MTSKSSSDKKPTPPAPIIHEMPSRTLYILESEMPEFKEILKIAKAGIPSRRVEGLVDKLSKSLE